MTVDGAQTKHTEKILLLLRFPPQILSQTGLVFSDDFLTDKVISL